MLYRFGGGVCYRSMTERSVMEEELMLRRREFNLPGELGATSVEGCVNQSSSGSSGIELTERDMVSSLK